VNELFQKSTVKNRSQYSFEAVRRSLKREVFQLDFKINVQLDQYIFLNKMESRQLCMIGGFGSTLLGFIIPKNSKIKREVERLERRIMESGLTEVLFRSVGVSTDWCSKYDAIDDDDDSNKLHPLSLTNLMILFQLL